MSKTKIFCLPYAGGSARIYHKWETYFSDFIEIVPVELAGRGERMNDQSYISVTEAIEDIYSLILPEIHVNKYALLGYSMGGTLAYELAQKIAQKGNNDPEHIFIMGRGAPNQKIREDKKYYLLDDENFKNRILQLGGTPPELFEYEELMELFVPILKNDLKLACTDLSKRDISPLNCPISLFMGKEDDISKEETTAWKMHTNRAFNTYYLNGGHFFFNYNKKELSNLIEFILLNQY